jgi:hypothetical protein
MEEKVEYIAAIFKIDASNTYLIIDIADDLSKVNNFDDYRKWLKTNLNHLDAKFLKPYEKFVFLTQKYIKQKLETENSERINKGREHAIELSNKVRCVSHYVVEHGATYSNFKTKDGVEAFSSFEQSQLEKVGGLLASVRLQKSISGADALADRLEELAYDLIVTNIIEYKSQKKTDNSVSKLLDGTIKKI